ncbi:MAG: ribulose-phosphate 3-epimerase [Thermodesulfovibrionales bacterium]|nr:ribulose-phosphate 3-epimerase [Thermodesulfovibrionales bacterium]
MAFSLRNSERTVMIAPSILSANFLKLEEELTKTEEAGADMLHIDIMDGHFVPNITIGPFVVEFIRKATKLPLDVHLMIEEPDRYIKDFISAGADWITVHYEALKHLHRTINWIRDSGAKPGVSLNPATPIWSLNHILHDIDMVLIMSVNPGFGGQIFIPQSLEKIKILKEMIRERGLHTLIEVDGGIKIDNARKVAEAGADILVMGSGFYNSKDYKSLMKELREVLEG